MKIKNYILLFVFMMGLGCNDGFLDKIPDDQLSDASFWSNSTDVEKYTNGIYRCLIAPVDDVILTDSYTDMRFLYISMTHRERSLQVRQLLQISLWRMPGNSAIRVFVVAMCFSKI